MPPNPIRHNGWLCRKLVRNCLIAYWGGTIFNRECRYSSFELRVTYGKQMSFDLLTRGFVPLQVTWPGMILVGIELYTLDHRAKGVHRLF
jgi:hypothetical protein